MRKTGISFLLMGASLILAFAFTSCKNINQMYNGEWHIIKVDSKLHYSTDVRVDWIFVKY